jgi:iron(III) transport system substrate-binding protein
MSRALPSLRRAAAAGLVALAAAALVAACGSPPAGKSAADLPTSAAELVAQARQEGAVVIGAGGHTRDQVQLLADTFRAKYGIPVTFVRESSGDIAQKTQAQLTSRSLQFDVVSLNDEATLRSWSESKVLTDAAVANRDRILRPLSTDNAPYQPFTWAALGYSYNSARLPAASAPASWDALAAHPGVFAVADPRSSGAALTFVAAMSDIDPRFLPALAGAKTLVSNSALALTQLLATGEADFGVPGIEADIATARKAGEPLAVGYPEGRIGTLPSYVAAMAQAPHPAAARLLVQFLLSEEYQAAQSGIGSRSVLTGAPDPDGAVHIAPDRLVVIDPADLAARKDALLKSFATTVGS